MVKCDYMKCSCGGRLRLEKTISGVWAMGEYEDEILKCDKCGKRVRLSCFGDIEI